MSNIPSAREMVATVKNSLVEMKEFGLADTLNEALDLMRRRRPVRRMKAKSPPIDAGLRSKIIQLATDTDMHEAEIAAEIGVNPGRVSEVLQRHHRINR